MDSFVVTGINLSVQEEVNITLGNINLLIGGVITKLLLGMSHVPGGWTGLETTTGSSNSKSVHGE